MALLPRRRLKCFYCNFRSAQTYTRDLRKWRCEHCDAVNHVDSRGEIIDPPAPEVAGSSRTKQYAVPVDRSKSATLPAPEQSIFCQKCLHNQHIVLQSLTNYLPPPTDPRYEEFERNLSSYRKRLEETYPQVCEECEPKVRDRIRQSGYMAKTDHLRRMRENTMNAMTHMRESWHRTSLLTLLGSTVWFVVVPTQLLWHGLGAMTREDDTYTSESTSFSQCLMAAASQHQIDAECAKRMHSPAGWMILLSIFTLWWNPIMRRRWIDRAVGLKEFYKLQLIILFVRVAGWYMLGKEKEIDMEPRVTKAVHAVMLVINTVLPIVTYRAVRIARSPRVVFQDTYEPLVPQKTANAPLGSQRPTPPNSQGSSSPSPSHGTRFEHRTPFAQTVDPPYHPPTPPPEGDEMDIDIPEKSHNLGPTRHRRADLPIVTQPSPFYGKLPAAPVSIEHRLRNPPNRPSFQKTSPERQESFFQSMTRGRALGAPNAHGSELEDSYSTVPEMRAPRFFPEKDRLAQETGLESWFSDFFSLGEPTPGLGQSPTENTINPSEHQHPEAQNLWPQCLPIVSLLLAAYAWTLAPTYPSFLSLSLYFIATGVGALVAGTRLRSTFSSSILNHSDLFLCLLELIGAGAIGYQIRKALLAGYSIDDELGAFPLWYFGFMIFQESAGAVSAYRANARLTGAEERREEYRREQLKPEKGDGKKERSPNRGQKALPMERALSQYAQSSQPSQSSPSLSFSRQALAQTPSRPAFPQAMDSFEQRITCSRAQTQGQRSKESPGSGALSGLSLGLDDGTPVQRRSTRLRGPGMGRVVNPWEVGGM